MRGDASSAYNYIRSKFVIASGMRELIKKHKLKIKYGVFSKAEAEIVRRTLDKFLADRGLAMEDFQRSLFEGGDFPIKDLIYECTQVCETRTYYTIFNHLAYTYHPYIRQRITEEEEIQLLDLVNQKGFRWKEIGYHLSKYKDLCQRKYLMLVGEGNHKQLTKKRIETMLSHMPSTEEEWTVVCRELKQKKPKILQAVKRFLNGKKLCGRETGKIEIQLCLLILNNNHYCKFNCDTQRIIDYLDGDVQAFEIVERREVSEAEMKNEEATNGQSRFLEKFLGLFDISEDFNLDVTINKDDIFWYNITREMNVEKGVSIVRFNELSRIYGWKKFRDIYDTIMKLAYDYAIVRTKQTLIEQISPECKTDVNRT